MTKLPLERAPDGLELFAALLIWHYRAVIEKIAGPDGDLESLVDELQEICNSIGNVSEPLRFTATFPEPDGERLFRFMIELSEVKDESP